MNRRSFCQSKVSVFFFVRRRVAGVGLHSVLSQLAFATLHDRCLCVYQSDLPRPVLVALAQGSRQPNALSFSLLSSKAAHHHGSLGRRFPSFH